VALFVAGVLALNLFALQDSAMVALRLGRFVPVENTSYGVAKLEMLAVFVGALPGFGIYASWVVPMLVLVPLVSGAVLWRRRDPRRVSEILGKQPSVPRLALDYVGYLFQVSSSFMFPVIALEVLDAQDAAVFSIAWLTSSTIDLLATQIGTALTVEASYGHDPVALRRTVLRKGLSVIAVIAVTGMLVAPLVLQIYGHTYSAHGVGTLRLLLLAGVSRSLITFTVAEARAHGNVTFIVLLRALTSSTAVGLSLVLGPRLGVEGMALAWLVAQTLGATVVVHRLWSGRMPVPEAAT
jgi:O-antigen/teichoic acid export membrane protein